MVYGFTSTWSSHWKKTSLVFFKPYFWLHVAATILRNLSLLHMQSIGAIIMKPRINAGFCDYNFIDYLIKWNVKHSPNDNNIFLIVYEHNNLKYWTAFVKCKIK